MSESTNVIEAPTEEIVKFEPFKNWKILGVIADTSACSYYRVANPVTIMGELGAEVQLSDRIGPEIISKHDIVLVPRQQTAEVYELIRHFVWDNKLFIYDIDDDLDHVTPENPAHRVYRQGRPEIHWIKKVMGACHGVTVTTPELQKWYSQANQNIHIVDNYIDFSLRNWQVNIEMNEYGLTHDAVPISKPAHRQGKFVIGYSGGDSHKDDFAVCAGDLSSFLRSHPDATLVLYTNPKLAEYWIQTHNFPKDQVEILQPVPFTEHPEGLFGMDVQLAPIQCTQFNLCKSSLKVKEGMAAGAAMIASCVGPYARFHHETNGAFQLVGKNKFSKSTWGEALNYYYNNPEILDRDKHLGRNLIIEKYSLEANIFKYAKAWKNIKDSATQGIIGPPNKVLSSNAYTTYKSLSRNDKCLLTDEKYKKGYYGAWGM